MDNRKWYAGASANPPAAPAAPSTGYPTDGDPLASIPATVPGAHWFYQLGEELRAVLAAAGIPPDQASLTQLLTALRSAGVFQTPAQFDNTTKAATTEFIQGALGNMSGAVVLGASTSITAAYLGKLVQVNSGSPVTQTLPDPSSIPSGCSVKFINVGGGACTISSSGAGGISSTVLGTGNPVLVSGDTIELCSFANNTWYVVGGSWALKHSSGQFGASLAASGYQKLPSGLIVQWGTFLSSGTSAGNAATAFPVAFPTACYGVFPSIAGAGSGDHTVQSGTLSTTTANLTTVLNTAIATGIGGYYFAIGK